MSALDPRDGIWIPPSTGVGEKIDFIFDIQEDQEKPAKDLYGRIRKLEPYASRGGSISYWDDKDFLPLQAADLVAWQHRRRLCRPGGPRREFERLHEDPLRHAKRVWSTEDMQELLANIKRHEERLLRESQSKGQEGS